MKPLYAQNSDSDLRKTVNTIAERVRSPLSPDARILNLLGIAVSA